MQSVAVVGFFIAFVYHFTDIPSLPIPFVGLLWLLIARCLPVNPGPFWVTYILLIYQLISFHDLNACLLDKCSTTKVFSSIALASTVIFWVSMKTSPNKAPKVPKVKEVNIPRLRMGESIQPRWV